jgi:hypothetical protein
MAEAWAAYRADWAPVLGFLRAHGFAPVREIINFLAEASALPAAPVPPGLALGPLFLEDLTRLLELSGGLLTDDDPDRLGDFFWDNPFFGPESLIAVRAGGGHGAVVVAALAIASAGFADPAELDAAMPCFRLGALGTEQERHKRVNGMVSCVFADESVGAVLLAEAGRRFRAAGLGHAAAQVPSDHPGLVAFYDRYLG